MKNLIDVALIHNNLHTITDHMDLRIEEKDGSREGSFMVPSHPNPHNPLMMGGVFHQKPT